MPKVKIVYTDDNQDKGVIGEKEAEDELFITIIDQYGYPIKIAKSRIILIKELRP